MDQYVDRAIEFRRAIHSYPEIGMQEHKTSGYILAKLKEAGFTKIITNVAQTGVVAELPGEDPSQFILLRADMDALPIREKTNLPFASKVDGMHHACGHDGHCAMLLAFAFYIQEQIRKGTKLRVGIKFCFQPGEEGFNGGLQMVQDEKNILDKVINCFGIHIISDIPLNKIGYTTGPVTAYSERFQIDIQGHGGHAMQPEQTIDALQVGVQICNSLYQIKGRNVNQTQKCTLSLGVFKAGNDAYNVIPENAMIRGSVRSLREEERKIIFQKIEDICKGAQLMHGCIVKFTYVSGYKAVINDEKMEVRMRKVLKDFEVIERSLDLGGEDFYAFADQRPSTFLFLGGQIDDNIVRPHHSPQFDYDERCLVQGIRLYERIVEEYCK